MPWGSGGGWQGGGGPWGSGPGPSNVPPEKPANDLDDLIRLGQDKFRGLFDGGSWRGLGLLALVIVALWLATGIYRVETTQQGIVMRFGKYQRTDEAGLSYHFPWPIETVELAEVTRLNKIEVGFRSPPAGSSRQDAERNIPEESLMLTGDENIVDVSFAVQWKIRDAKKFLFSIRGQESTVKSAAESAVREVIGRNNDINQILTEGRQKIEDDSHDLLQQILDSYDSGIDVVNLQITKPEPPAEVIDAFRDVQTAKADKERLINEAETYRNDIIPKARGQAEQMLQEAQAYKEKTVARAEGEAKRFVAVYEEYKQAKEVTKKRLYLETMEEVLTDMNKIVIEENAKGAGVVPYLPLPELTRKTQQESTN